MFQQNFQIFPCSQRYSATRRIFNSLLGVWKLMARNSGHRNGARARLLDNMAAKHSKEMYGRNKTK